MKVDKSSNYNKNKLYRAKKVLLPKSNAVENLLQIGYGI